MHQHAHSHGDRRAQNKRRLKATLLLTLAYMVAEIVGGYLAGSLALLADAGHMFSDAAAIGLSLLAAWIADRPATSTHTFGYYRAEILAALVNAATLIAVALFVFVEAAGRLVHPAEVKGGWMMAVAVGGLAVNIAGLAILRGGKTDNLNMHGAWLHLLTDALGSVAAIFAGVAVWAWGWNAADPIASILIGLLVIFSAWNLLKEAIAILMESTPRHLDPDTVRSALARQPGVCGVHDLHMWTITSGMESLSVHVVVLQGQQRDEALVSIRKMLHDEFGIDHSTIQMESDDAGPCHGCC